MITTKTVYRVPDCLESWEGIGSIPFGVWCTNNQDARHMTMEDAWKCSNRISGRVVDESISECLIFAFLDSANYAYDDDKFIEISFEELIQDCKPIELVVCE